MASLDVECQNFVVFIFTMAFDVDIKDDIVSKPTEKFLTGLHLFDAYH